MKWLIAVLVAMLYVQLFNQVAHMYFDSERTLTLYSLYRHFVPPMTLTL
jgi:hypothetical protein